MPFIYRRREPEHEVLRQCVVEHLPAFLAKIEQAGRTLPAFVRKELERFVDCGVLARGFARVVCEKCGFTRLVALSCKGRGVCCSCISRRMSDVAAHLVDNVIPKDIPVRQWVLSLPVPLRYLLAWDTALCTQVIRIFIKAVFRYLQRTAKSEFQLERPGDAHTGATCMVQRWGGSLNLNVHLHALVADGVFVRERDSGALVFRALPAPSRGDIAAVAWEVCERVVALLRKRGQWEDASPDDDLLAQTEPALAQLYSASISGTLLMGPNAGQRQMRLLGKPAHQGEDGKIKNAYGFDVDAGVRIAGHDRGHLERLARYMLRPPLSKSRLERQPDGRYRIWLKKPWRDGTKAVVLDGPELLGRLAALVPPPRAHLTRYLGVFAQRAALRNEVIPNAKPNHSNTGCMHAADTEKASEKKRQHRLSWSQLLSRVFAIDVLACDRCGSRMQRVEWCLRAERIKAVLGDATGPPVGLSITEPNAA